MDLPETHLLRHHPRSIESETARWGPSNPVLTSLVGDSNAPLSLIMADPQDRDADGAQRARAEMREGWLPAGQLAVREDCMVRPR